MVKDEMTLKVSESISQRDIGHGIARLDPEVMREMGLSEGDCIEIIGDRKTAAIVASSQTDIGLGAIRIDGLIRKNSGSSIGEEVTIKKVNPIEAKKVVLAPIENNIKVQGDVRSLFAGKIMVQGDIITSQVRSSPSSMGMGFDSLFDNFMDFSPMTEIKFAVVSTNPAGVVVVGANTEVDVKEEPVDVASIDGVSNLIDVTYEDIGGLKEEVKKVREMIEIPLKRPELFEKLGITPPKGVLMQGPPGTGKTLLAKAVANESEANFISVKGPELLSKWVGDSEAGVREVFRKARQAAPTVIFFDEIDSIASSRGGNDGDSGVTKRVVNQLLTEMDGMEELEDVAVIAATNRPDILDAGLMRPGRFDRHIKVDVPNEEGRLAIFKVHTKDMPIADDVDLEKLAKETEGYVGADIESVCREAAMLTLRNDIDSKEVTNKYFQEALEKVKPSDDDSELMQYM